MPPRPARPLEPNSQRREPRHERTATNPRTLVGAPLARRRPRLPRIRTGVIQGGAGLEEPGGDGFLNYEEVTWNLTAGLNAVGHCDASTDSDALMDRFPVIVRVFAFNPATGEFDSDTSLIPTILRAPFPINPGTGLFVVATEPAQLAIDLTATYGFTLPAGLSLAAYCGPTTSADSLLLGTPALDRFCDFGLSRGFRCTSLRLPPTVREDFTLAPGTGIFVFLDQPLSFENQAGWSGV